MMTARLTLTLVALHLLLVGGAMAAGSRDSSPRRQLAYYSYQQGEGHIWLVDVERGLRTTLLRGDWDLARLVWSPDGNRLAFVAYTHIGFYHPYVLDMATRRWISLGDAAFSSEALRWSPDGRWLAVSSVIDDHPAISLIDPATGAMHSGELDSLQGISRLSWSADSAQLAFSGWGDSADLYVIDAACIETDCPPQRLFAHPAADHLPEWSPVDTHLAFVSDRDGFPAIYLMDAHCGPCGVEARRVANLRVDTTTLRWSPDGTTLAFTSSHNGVDPSVYIVDVTCADCLMQNYRVSLTGQAGFQPDWSPDSRTIAYVTRFLNVWDIALIDVDCTVRSQGCAGQSHLLTGHDALVGFPVWRPVWRPG